MVHHILNILTYGAPSSYHPVFDQRPENVTSNVGRQRALTLECKQVKHNNFLFTL